MQSPWFRVVVFSVLAACGNGSGGDGVDAGPADAGVPDGSPADAASPDAGESRACVGEAFACDLRTNDDCAAGFGCELLYYCAGAAWGCLELVTEDVCESQDGCSWLGETEGCTGSAEGCFGRPIDDGCLTQAGCSIESACEGTAEACPSLAESTCEQQLDCHVNGSFAGTHVLTLTTPVLPETPFLWRARIAQTFQADGSATATVALVAYGASDRQPVGDAVTVEGVAIGADGSLSIALDDAVLPAEANGISGTELTFDLALTGMLTGDGHVCGTADGQVTAPTAIDLTGSTWTLQRVRHDAAGDALPDAPACP